MGKTFCRFIKGMDHQQTILRLLHKCITPPMESHIFYTEKSEYKFRNILGEFFKLSLSC